jgi:uncharacterized protein YqjF (DUF2071 family)
MKLKRFPLPGYLQSFEEINLRTYVVKDGIPGIYLLSIETNKLLIALFSRLFLHLPYRTSEIDRLKHRFISENTEMGFNLDMEIKRRHTAVPKRPLDYWLTERHCLYKNEHNHIYRYDIHHREWELENASVKAKDIHYHIGKFYTISLKPEIIHYCKKLEVLLWGRTRVS